MFYKSVYENMHRVQIAFKNIPPEIFLRGPRCSRGCQFSGPPPPIKAGTYLSPTTDRGNNIQFLFVYDASFDEYIIFFA